MSVQKALSLAEKKSLLNLYAMDEIKSFTGLIKGWEKEFFEIMDGSRGEIRKKINSWLDDMERTYSAKMKQVNLVAGYGGFALTQMAGNMDADFGLYKQAFADQVLALSAKDISKARLLRNSLAIRLKKNIDKVYSEYDKLIKESLGLSLEQIQEQFTEKAIYRDNLLFIDRSGNYWTPDRYSEMWARTRSREITDIITERDMDDLEMDVVWISDVSTITPLCKLYEGKYFSRFGRTPGLPVLDMKPPFHPNCRHQAIPVRADRITQYISINKKLDITVSHEKGSWTESEKRQISKARAWNRANR